MVPWRAGGGAGRSAATSIVTTVPTNAYVPSVQSGRLTLAAGKYTMVRTASVPAPGGSHGPMAAQNGGSRTDGYAPPALGLPRTTKMRMASPMPTMSSST